MRDRLLVLLVAAVSSVAGCVLRAADPSLPASGPVVTVSRFEFMGGTVFPTNRLEAVVAPYTQRPVGEAELLAAADAVTALYRDHGYWNSGADLPDQDITNGVVRLRIVEGRLSEIRVHGTRRLKPDWIERRIRVHTPAPLRLQDLATGLQQLRRNPNVEFVAADLQPLRRATNVAESASEPRPPASDDGVVLGASLLDLRVQEASPWRASLQVDNQRPLSVGEFELLMNLADENLTGHGDSLSVNYGILQQKVGGGVEFSGDGNIGVNYSLPVTPRDFRVETFYDRSNFAVVQAPFNELDIQSSYWGAGLRLSQPVWVRLGEQVKVGMVFERRHSEGTLLGDPFPITPGSINGQVNVSVLRLTADWNRAGSNSVLAVQVMASVGLDAFEATILPGQPDGQFVSFSGNSRYQVTLWETGGISPGHNGQLILRGGFLYTPDALPAMEQLSFGGINSVRGYPVNYAVRDSGLFTSAELRLPLLEHRRAALSAGPFVDFGAGWNVDAPTPVPPTLSSLGLSVQALFWNQLSLQVSWAYGFNRTLYTGNDPEYHGVSFVLAWQVL